MIRASRLKVGLSILLLITMLAPVSATSAVAEDNIAFTLQTERDLEAELETQPETTYEAGDTLTATFHVFEFRDRATDDATVTITPPFGVTDLTVTCEPEGMMGGSTCPMGELGASFTIPTIAGESGVLITVDFIAPANATGDLELAVEVTPPFGTEETADFDNLGAATWFSGQPSDTRDLEAELEPQAETTYEAGDTLTATFRVFEFRDRATDDATITITPPFGVTDLTVSCELEDAVAGSTCPTGDLGTTFTIPTIAGQSGLLITVAFSAPANATADLELAMEVTPPAGTEETAGFDNLDIAVWSSGEPSVNPDLDSTNRDLEVNLLAQPTDVHEPGTVLMATFRVFEFVDRAIDDATITITPPTGVTDLAISCVPQDPLSTSLCPTGELGTSFSIPAIAGESGVFITVAFIAPDNATGTLELELEATVPTGFEETTDFDNRETASWSS